MGFMQATYWQLWTSFSVSFCRSYLHGETSIGVPRPPTPQPSNASNVARKKTNSINIYYT